MINLTKQERLILIFLGFATLSGVILDMCLKKLPHSDIFYSDVIVKRSFAIKININSADKEELTKIRGIGPVLAQRIIDYRILHGRFSNIDDIIYVKGIGKKKLQQIRDFIKID